MCKVMQVNSESDVCGILWDWYSDLRYVHRINILVRSSPKSNCNVPLQVRANWIYRLVRFYCLPGCLFYEILHTKDTIGIKDELINRVHTLALQSMHIQYPCTFICIARVSRCVLNLVQSRLTCGRCFNETIVKSS